MIRLDVTHGASPGSNGPRHESTADVIRIGRSADNDLVLTGEIVSGEHARIQRTGEQYLLRDLRSTNGTAVVRGGERFALDDARGREMELAQGDVVELGSGDHIVSLAVT